MRIHVLGVGSIGTLLAYHLRKQAISADGARAGAGGREVALLLRRRGLPGGNAKGKKSSVPSHPPPTPTLGVEKSGVYHSLQGFTHEFIGPALDTAVTHYARTRTLNFPSSALAASKTSAALRALQTPHISTDPIDSLIVALKCHQTLPVMQQLQHRLRPESCITLIQNGMGVYDELCTTIWPDPVTRPQFILGSTTHGARLWTPKKAKPTSGGGLEFERSVVHTGEGEVVFGVVPDPRREVDYDQRLFGLDSAGNGTQQYSLAMPIDSPRLPLPSLSPSTSNERTTQTPLEATLTALLSLHELNPSLLPMPNMYRSLLQKLAVNCAVNPTTGLLAVLNGALVGSPHAGWLIRAIVEECSEVMTKYLASLASPTTTSADGTTHSPLDPETVAAFSPDSLERRTLQVLATTARNTSSMASDMSRLSLANPNSSTSSGGTEIEYITGYLARLGERMGIPTPVNRTMLELVKGKEEIYGMSPGMVVRSPDARVETRRANMGKKKVVEKQETVTAKI